MLFFALNSATVSKIDVNQNNKFDIYPIYAAVHLPSGIYHHQIAC